MGRRCEEVRMELKLWGGIENTTVKLRKLGKRRIELERTICRKL